MGDSISNIKIHRGKIKHIKIYDVTEEELKNLEYGAARLEELENKARTFETSNRSSLFLNIAISLLTSALSATIAYITVDTPSLSTLTFILSIIISGYTIGIILLYLHFTIYKNQKENISGNKHEKYEMVETIQKIRARIESIKTEEKEAKKIA